MRACGLLLQVFACLLFAAACCVHAQTPGQPSARVPDIATLQAQLSALQTALQPPSCVGSSFLQYNVTVANWVCTNATALISGGTPGYSGVPPDCQAPGGARLLYNKQAGWMCACNAGWSGSSCTVSSNSSAALYPLDTMQWLVEQMQLLSAQMAVLRSMLPTNASSLFTVGVTCGPPGGVASQLVNGVYVCLCSPGWSGNLCDIPPRSLITIAGTLSQLETGASSYTCMYGTYYCPDHANAAAFVNGVGVNNAHFKNPGHLALDSTQTWLAIADSDNNAIRVLTLATGAVTTLAGNGTQGSLDGGALNASFNAPNGIAVSASGAVFVSDYSNHVIRVITNGVVSTLAGSAGASGFVDGIGSAARFYYPRGIALSADGSVLYVADASNHAIRAVSTATGATTTLAGKGTGIFLDGPVQLAGFNYPLDVSLAISSNMLYVADTNNYRIRVVNLTSGVVRTIAGNGAAGFLDGLSAMAFLNGPQLVQFDPSTGHVLFYDNNRLRSVDPTSGLVTTVATAQASTAVAMDGDALSVAFKANGLAVDASGNVYIADGFHLIRKLLFSGAPALAPTSSAQCSSPGTMNMVNTGATWLCVCKAYWAGSKCQVLPRSVAFLAGTLYNNYYWGYASLDGSGSSASFVNSINALAYTATSSELLLLDYLTVRRVSLSGNVTAIAGGTTAARTCTGNTNFYPGTGTAACFNTPRGLAVSPDGSSAYVSSSGAHVIMKVTLATNDTQPFAGSWNYYSFFGNTGSWNGIPGFIDSSTGVNGTFRSPNGLACDTAGNVWVADTGNHAVRRVSPSGQIVTIAGNGVCGLVDDVGTAAQLCAPQGITVSPSGDVIVADTNNMAIRRISATGDVNNPSYTVTTVAVTAGAQQNTPASLSGVAAVQVDSSGNIYATTSGSRILMWSPTSLPGLLSYVAGTGQGFQSNYDTQQQAIIADVTSIRISNPVTLALAPDGTLYTNDNLIIRAIGPQATE